MEQFYSFGKLYSFGITLFFWINFLAFRAFRAFQAFQAFRAFRAFVILRFFSFKIFLDFQAFETFARAYSWKTFKLFLRSFSGILKEAFS